MSSPGPNLAVRERVATTHNEGQDESVTSTSRATSDTLIPSTTPAVEKGAIKDQEKAHEVSNDSKADTDFPRVGTHEAVAGHPMSLDLKQNAAYEDSICFAFGPKNTYFFGTTCGCSLYDSLEHALELVK